MQRGWSQALFTGAQWQNKRQRAQTKAQEVPSEHQETLLCCAVDEALAQVAQRCGGSLLGDLQRPPGHGPDVPAVADPMQAVVA